MKHHNVQDFVKKELVDKGNIIKVGPRTTTITDYIIEKTRDDLIRNLVQLRRDLIDPHGRQLFGETFPIGQCAYIRDVVYEILKAAPRGVCPEFPDISPFSIPLRKIWCIQGDRYMNNALQYGNWIIDAANDTADTSKYPVTVLKIKDSNTRNPRNHEDLCTILEKYWTVKCFPNVYYPELAPFFPVIFTQDEKVGFAERSMIGIDSEGIFNGFSSAYDFLYRSSFSKKRLSEEHVEKLMSRDIGEFPNAFLARSGVTRKDIEKSFARKRKRGPNILAQQHINCYGALGDLGMLIGDGV